MEKVTLSDYGYNAANIEINIPSPIALMLTRIVIIQDINNSSPHPVSPKINKLNLIIVKKKKRLKPLLNLLDFIYEL